MKMQKTIEYLENSYKFIHFKLTPSMVENFQIGNEKLYQLGQVTKDKNYIYVDTKTPNKIIEHITKIGYNVFLKTKTQVAISIPGQSTEDKQIIYNYIKRLAEDAKIAIRNIRREMKNSLETKELDNLTKKYTKQIDDMVTRKIKSLS